MGIETRKGNLYLYRKRREGDRVISEYVGGDVADLMAYKAEKEARARERARIIAECRTIDGLDAQIDRAYAMVDDVVNRALTAAGFHYQRGEWRKRRNAGSEKETE